MDEERIQKVVDEFTDRLKRELESMVRQVRESAENALEEINALGLTESDASGLLMELTDFGAIINQGRKASLRLCEEIFEMTDRMDPEEEWEARRRILERLKIFYAEFEKMMRGY